MFLGGLLQHNKVPARYFPVSPLHDKIATPSECECKCEVSGILGESEMVARGRLFSTGLSVSESPQLFEAFQ